MNMVDNGESAPKWRKLRALGLGFLIVGIALFVADRLTEDPFLAGLGPGFTVGGIVILGAAFMRWHDRGYGGRAE